MKDLILNPQTDDEIEVEYSIEYPTKKLLGGDTSKTKESYSEIISAESKIETFEFEQGISEFDKTNYLLSAASGLLSGLLNVFWSKEFDLTEAQNWGKEKIEKLVCKTAKMQGCKKEDLSSAIAFLEKKCPIVADKLTNDYGGGYSHHLRDFSHHPTILGLISSILNQYHIGIGTDTNGNLKIIPIEDNPYIGKNFEEKIFNGVIMWVLHLVSDMAGSSLNPGNGTGIPGPILSFFKEISTMPIIKDIKTKYKDDEITLSVFISKLFNGTYFKDENNNPIRIDLRTEIGVLAFQSKSVLINECIVRAMYTLRNLYKQIQLKNVETIKDLRKLNVKEILPFNSRSLTRMLTISHGVFVLVDLSKAAIKSGGKDFAKFFLNINYVGIGRFVFACKADAGYIEEDARKGIEEFIKKHTKKTKIVFDFKLLSLTEEQMRILHSLELQKIYYDISFAKKDKESKSNWCKKWKEQIIAELNKDNTYFIEDSKELYNIINNPLNTSNDYWVYLIGIELYLFKPYFKLDSSDKKIRLNTKYCQDVFAKQQHCLSINEFNNLIKTYNNFYKNVLQNKRTKTIVGISTTAVATAITGGLGWAFAPQIATIIAGDAVAGLSGAALTSASLAFVGGGSLAAGGLGMAGGTAILTGGGALIGLASSSATTFANVITNVSNTFILEECAKLLTYCKCWLIEKCNDIENVHKIQECIEQTIFQLEEKYSSEVNKDSMKQLKTNIKYLKKCNKALEDMINKNI